MLTGDNKKVANWVSEELGPDEYFAEILPNEKATKIKEVQARGLVVTMTGDGINDAGRHLHVHDSQLLIDIPGAIV